MSIETTPSKTCVSLNNPIGCIICQKEEKNQRKRKSLGGKTSSALLLKLVEVLEVPQELLNSSASAHRYICESPCSRDLDNHLKYKEKSDELKNDLLQRFNSNFERRTKRGLPSDIEPENSIRSRSAKSLAFSVAKPQHEQAFDLEEEPRAIFEPLLPAPAFQQQRETCCYEGTVDINIQTETAKEIVLQQECQAIEVNHSYVLQYI